jgi:amidase
MADELWRQPAVKLAVMIAKGETTSTAVVEAHLARIADVNPAVNAIPVLLADEALAGASAADAAVKGGAALGPFHGVPFTVKFNIDAVGTPTTHGVPAFAEAMPTIDHPMVERMKKAGGIPIGRTNLPDMALRVHTDSALYGLSRNPWNLGRTTGGSSGGEAAALASGMTPLGLGNDIGGSLRNPAFCCGIASLKPGFGRIPTASSIEPASGLLVGQLMAVQGPMARTVGDLRTALSVLAGPHPRDPFSFPAPLRGPAPAAPIRVAVVAEPPGGAMDAGLAAAVRTAAAALKDAGYDVREAQPPMIEEAVTLWGRWLAGEFALQREILASIMSKEAMGFFDGFLDVFGPLTLGDHANVMMQRHVVARAWSEFFAEYPIILGPTWAQPQFEHGFDVARPDSARGILELMRFVTPMNLLGLPVVCVPVGVTNGLPTGVQVIGDRFREDLCLDAGEAIEKRLGGADAHRSARINGCLTGFGGVRSVTGTTHTSGRMARRYRCCASACEETHVPYTKPIPTPSPHTKPFWDGCKAGKLMLPRCTNCNRVHWYPRLICPHCHSMELEWIEGSGDGRIHTFAVQHRAFGAWAEEAPFVTAYIDVSEGGRMLTVLRGVDPLKPEEIKIGSRVKVEFEAANEDMHIPFWRVI